MTTGVNPLCYFVVWLPGSPVVVARSENLRLVSSLFRSSAYGESSIQIIIKIVCDIQ